MEINAQLLTEIDAQGPYVGDHFRATNGASAIVTVVCVEGDRIGYTLPRTCAGHGHGRTNMVTRARFTVLFPERVWR